MLSVPRLKRGQESDKRGISWAIGGTCLVSHRELDGMEFISVAWRDRFEGLYSLSSTSERELQPSSSLRIT